MPGCQDDERTEAPKNFSLRQILRLAVSFSTYTLLMAGLHEAFPLLESCLSVCLLSVPLILSFGSCHWPLTCSTSETNCTCLKDLQSRREGSLATRDHYNPSSSEAASSYSRPHRNTSSWRAIAFPPLQRTTRRIWSESLPAMAIPRNRFRLARSFRDRLAW